MSIPITSFAQINNYSTHLLASCTSKPWEIDSGDTDHTAGTSSVFFYIQHCNTVHNMTLANGSNSAIEGIRSA